MQLGLQAGDCVMVHAAMRRVGPLLNGPDALIGALLDVVGPEGTLASYVGWDSVHEDLLDADGRVLATWRDHVPGFDPLKSRAVRMNGILAEFIRTTPGALMSGNPGASVVAIGRLAGWITADHPLDYGYGEGSPLAKLVEAGGRVLMVGAPWDTMTLLHLAEHRARLAGKRVIRFETPFAGDGGVQWRFQEEYDTSEPVVDGLPEDVFERIVRAFVAEGGGMQGPVGQAPALLVDAQAVLGFAVGWLERWAA